MCSSHLDWLLEPSTHTAFMRGDVQHYPAAMPLCTCQACLPCLHLHLQCRQLLSQRAFDSSYTSISASGARYLADKTQVALVGIDYLSIGMYDEIGDAHRTLLGKVRSGYNRVFVL